MKYNYNKGDANNDPVSMIVLGAIFVGITGYTYFSGQYNDSTATKIGVVVFGVVGICMVVYGIYRAIVLSLLKKLQNDENAYTTVAKFTGTKVVSSTTNRTNAGFGNQQLTTAFNARIYQKVLYTYSDENGVERKGKSLLSYYPNQVKYLEEKRTFNIKCKGNLSLITEEVPTEQNLININLFDLKNSEIHIK